MTLQNQIKIWVAILVIGVLMLWVFRGILLPFVVGMALAYLFDPLADRLEKWHFSRFWATATIMIVATLLFIGVFVLFVPLIVQQVAGLAQGLPGYVTQLQALASQWAPQISEWLGEARMAQFEGSLASLTDQGVSFVGRLAAQIMQSGLGVINALGLLVISPVVAFYMLLDWDRTVSAADKLLPQAYRDEIRSVFKDIDSSMAGVIRGQVSVMVLLAAFYATALSLSGLSYGLVIGLTAGLLGFIPYVGFLVGFLLSMGVALVQFWPDWVMIAVIFTIFMVGQFLEGNVLYPKLVGKSIRVHPVWLMFALFAFGLLFGFVGLLLAVPMAAIAGVLVRFGVRKYKESGLYLAAGASLADGENGDDPTQID